jgi:hypothetical protein
VGRRTRFRGLLSRRATVVPLAGCVVALAACSSSSPPPLAAPLPPPVSSSPVAASSTVTATGPATFNVTVQVLGPCSQGCKTDTSSNTVTATDCGTSSPRGSVFARYGQEVTITDVMTGRVGHGTLKSYDSPPQTVTDPPQAMCRFTGTVSVSVGTSRPGIRTVRVALGPESVGLLTARLVGGTTNYAVLVNV